MDPTGKSWKSPGGQVKTVTTILWIGGLAAAGFLVADKVLPLIVRVLRMGIHAGLLLIPAAIIVIILTSPRFWFFLHYFIKRIGSFIVGFWQDLDPVGILEACLEDMKHRKERIQRAALTVAGVIRDLKETVAANETARVERLKLAGAAHKAQNPYAFALNARKAGRLQRSNFTFGALLQKLEVLQRVLKRMAEAAEFVVEDKTDEVAEIKKRKKAVNAAYGAMKDAWAIIKGGKVKDLYDSTFERLVTSLNEQLGEIDGFMDIAEGFISTVDLQNGVYEEDALAQLLEWEKKIDSVILGDEKQQLLQEAGIAVDVEVGGMGQRSGQSGRYSRLLGGGDAPKE